MKRAEQKIEIIGDTAYITIIYNGEPYVVKVDADDYYAVKGRRWSILKCISSSGRPYYYANNRAIGLMHRYITDAQKGMEVDHINHDTLDNRNTNLRVVTPSENRQNTSMKSSNASGVRGVKWSSQCNKWRAYFIKEGKEYHVGFFDDVEDAEERLKLFRAKYLPTSQEANDLVKPSHISELSNTERIRSDNTSGVKGISWENRRNYWRVRVKGKEIFTSPDFEEAKKFLEDYKRRC